MLRVAGSAVSKPRSPATRQNYAARSCSVAAGRDDGAMVDNLARIRLRIGSSKY